MQPYPSLQTKQYCGHFEQHEGAERRSLEAVLIHKHRARLSPRLIPGPSPRSALHIAWQRVRESNPCTSLERAVS